MNNEQAKGVLDFYKNNMEAQNQQAKIDVETSQAQAQNLLRQEWGRDYDANINKAKSLATAITLAISVATVLTEPMLVATVFMLVALATAALMFVALEFTALILAMFALIVVKAVLLAGESHVFSI